MSALWPLLPPAFCSPLPCCWFPSMLSLSQLNPSHSSSRQAVLHKAALGKRETGLCCTSSMQVGIVPHAFLPMCPILNMRCISLQAISSSETQMCHQSGSLLQEKWVGGDRGGCSQGGMRIWSTWALPATCPESGPVMLPATRRVKMGPC